MKRILALAFACIAFHGCSTESTDVALTYAETSCADPWSPGGLPEIKAFLESKDIHPIAVYRRRNAPKDTAFCEACTCSNGWEIIIVVHPEDRQKAEDLGFSKT